MRRASKPRPLPVVPWTSLAAPVLSNGYAPEAAVSTASFAGYDESTTGQ